MSEYTFWDDPLAGISGGSYRPAPKPKRRGRRAARTARIIADLTKPRKEPKDWRERIARKYWPHLTAKQALDRLRVFIHNHRHEID